MHKPAPDDEDCRAVLEAIRWRGRPRCPYCHSERATVLPKERRYRCNNCRTGFSVTTGTVFHRTHLPLGKWFVAISLILDARRGVSARRLAEQVGINKNTACYISKRIDKAMHEASQRDLLLEIAEINDPHDGKKDTQALGVAI